MANVRDQRSNKYVAVDVAGLVPGVLYRVRSDDAQHGLAVIATNVPTHPVLILETGVAVTAVQADPYLFEQAEGQIVLTA